MKKFKYYILALSCQLCSILIASGQEYNYAHYTTANGLAGETIYGIVQDHDGFLWIGTETGMSRFDGRQFKNFTITDGLPSNEVLGFREDNKSRLWIITFSKEICYYYKGRIYNRYNDKLLKEVTFLKEIKILTCTKKNEIIISDWEHNIVVIDSVNKVHRYKNETANLPYTQLRKGASILTSQLALPADVRTTVQKNNLTYCMKLWENAFWFQSDVFNNMKRKEYLQNAYIWYGNKKKWIQRPALLQQIPLDYGNILETYRSGGGGIFDLIHERKTEEFLPGTIINGACLDKEQNLWFGTRGNGLFKLSKEKVLGYTLNKQQKIKSIQFIYKKQSDFFIGATENQFWKLTNTTRKNYNGVPVFEQKELNENTEWLSTNAQGVYINYANSNFLNLAKMSHEIPMGGIKSIYAFSDSILVAHSLAVHIYKGGRNFSIKELFHGRATAAIRYSNYYYIGTLYGLWVLNLEGKQLFKLLPYHVSCFAPDKKGTLWVGTDKGVFAFRDNKITGEINVQNTGISSNLCRCIFPTDDYLWIGTDKGINKVAVTNAGNKLAAVYTMANGLDADIINTILIDSNIVYVGTSKGLNIFNEQLSAPGRILGLKFTGISILDSSVSQDKQLFLPHGDNSIQFEYSGISFSLNQVSYRYRLLGLSDRWQTTSEQMLRFISLPSGKYKLQLQAVSPYGVKSGIIEKEFRVRKAIYEQWWFRILSGLIILGSIFFIFHLRNKKLRKAELKERKINKKILELQQTALRAQMNPHFIFNCLNSIQHYVLKQDVKGANFYLSQFAGLIRQTLDHSSQSYITLKEEIAYLNRYVELERLQADYPFEFSINVDPDIDKEVVLVPGMIIQPFVENALKHGLARKPSGGYLLIEWKQEGKTVTCRIEDNGAGIRNAQKTIRHSEYRPKGMSLTEERIKTLNLLRDNQQQISFEIEDMGQQAGTRVTVHIPVDIDLNN